MPDFHFTEVQTRNDYRVYSKTLRKLTLQIVQLYDMIEKESKKVTCSTYSAL